jgi:hypothetical protein
MLLWRAFTFGPMSADQHKQIGFLHGAIFIQYEKWFYYAKWKLLTFAGVKGLIRNELCRILLTKICIIGQIWTMERSCTM